jgi:hypothetical protein
MPKLAVQAAMHKRNENVASFFTLPHDIMSMAYNQKEECTT